MWRSFLLVLAPLVVAVRHGHQSKEAGQLTHRRWNVVGLESSRLETPRAEKSKNAMKAAESVFLFPSNVYNFSNPVLGCRQVTVIFWAQCCFYPIFGAGVPASRFGFAGKVELPTYDSSDQSWHDEDEDYDYLKFETVWNYKGQDKNFSSWLAAATLSLQIPERFHMNQTADGWSASLREKSFSWFRLEVRSTMQTTQN